MNAADDHKRADAIARLLERFEASRAAGRRPHLRVVMHSLAFGSLLPFLAEDPKGAISRKQMEMTLDVMANSLVYWVQDLWRGRAARARLEGLRDDLRGLGPDDPVVRCRLRGQGRPRVALPPARDGARAARRRAWPSTPSGPASRRRPALRKIPEAARVIELTLVRNPHGRLTTVEDVADAIVTLASTDSDWINGNVINVDGGEFHTG